MLLSSTLPSVGTLNVKRLKDELSAIVCDNSEGGEVCSCVAGGVTSFLAIDES